MTDTNEVSQTTETQQQTSAPVDESLVYAAQVKWYNPKKNYGFATILDTGEDIFIHKNSIVGNSQEEERFWNKCVFEGEFISMTLKNDLENGRVTGENIKSSLRDGDGKLKPLLFVNPNMKSYINKFRERWSNSHENEWKTVSHNKQPTF
jgi:hypothetical protein